MSKKKDEMSNQPDDKLSNPSSNPFSAIGQDVNEDQLDIWNQMNERLRGLVQMSDEDDDEVDDDDDDDLEDVMIDDSLLVTNVTADSFNITTQNETPTPSKPSTSSASQSRKRDVHAPTELTLQYLTGKITFIEFSELMEQENMQEIHIEVLASEPAAEETVVTKPQPTLDTDLAELAARNTKKHRIKKKARRRKCQLPAYLESSMGEVNMTFARGNHDEAIKQCLEVIRLAPNASKPFQTMGMIYEDMGDMQKSLQFSLIAAYLDPSDGEEWARLASMCLEQNDTDQAVKCYSRAVAAGGANKKTYIWERCKLYESLKEHRKAVDGYQMLLPLLSDSDSETYFKLARGIARNFYDSGEKTKAIETMANGLKEHPDKITSEDVNLLLELHIPEKEYAECLAVLVKHCGVSMKFVGDKVWSSDCDMPIAEFHERTPVSCEVPEMLPIDLRVKLAICLINFHLLKIVQVVLEPLFAEDIEGNGDLYLDIAEAYMDTQHYKHALPILKSLVHNQNYNLAAVWLKYGECLKSLNDIHGAVQAYTRVVTLAPTHIGAKMSLSALQQQLGKHDEALEALEHEEVEERKLTREEQLMLLQKCHLLNAQGKLDEFLITAKQLLFQEWRDLEAEDMNYLQAIRTYKHRKDSLIAHFNSKGKETFHAYTCLTKTKSSQVSISLVDLWDMFKALCSTLIKNKRYAQFEDVTLLGMLCPLFSQEEKLMPDLAWLILTASIISKNSQRAYPFGRHMVLEKLECIPVWNMFMQVIMVGNDGRHNRFLLRKMVHEPNNIALGIMNGHTSMATGSYKHSLGEYANVFKRIPTDPMVSLCIGLDFIHTASQRFSAKRQYLITQGLAFLHNYLEIRGECQETYYNLGRALHQINIVYAAIHFYKKALEFPPCIGESGGRFDLTCEIAYNLSLIYQASGATDYAKYLLYKYCVL